MVHESQQSFSSVLFLHPRSFSDLGEGLGSSSGNHDYTDCLIWGRLGEERRGEERKRKRKRKGKGKGKGKREGKGKEKERKRKGKGKEKEKKKKKKKKKEKRKKKKEKEKEKRKRKRKKKKEKRKDHKQKLFAQNDLSKSTQPTSQYPSSPSQASPETWHSPHSSFSPQRKHQQQTPTTNSLFFFFDFGKKWEMKHVM